MKFSGILLAGAFLLHPLAIVAQNADGVNPLILGGQPVTSISETPWQVALVFHGTRTQFCGGALVAPGWVLTAASCVDNPTVRRDAGRLDVVAGTLTYRSGGMQQTVSDIIVHPNWRTSASQYDFDAALLKLSAPLPVSDDIKPIQMNEAGLEIPTEVTVRVSGWGATVQGGSGSANLLYADVPVVSNAECNRPGNYDGRVTLDKFCAGYRSGGADACQGDLGGPSDVIIRGKDTLVGVVTGDIGCAQKLKYGAYTRVSSISDWASNVIASN